jgi:hypothetical protein
MISALQVDDGQTNASNIATYHEIQIVSVDCTHIDGMSWQVATKQSTT